MIFPLTTLKVTLCIERSLATLDVPLVKDFPPFKFMAVKPLMAVVVLVRVILPLRLAVLLLQFAGALAPVQVVPVAQSPPVLVEVYVLPANAISNLPK